MDLEVFGKAHRGRDRRHGVRIEIDQATARFAEQMVMWSGHGIESAGGPGVEGAVGQPQKDQGIQDPIYGHAGESGDPRPELLVELVGGGVPPAIQEGLVHRSALPGQGDSSIPAPALQLQ
jgi:hypothetical protein